MEEKLAHSGGSFMAQLCIAAIGSWALVSKGDVKQQAEL